MSYHAEATPHGVNIMRGYFLAGRGGIRQTGRRTGRTR